MKISINQITTKSSVGSLTNRRDRKARIKPTKLQSCDFGQKCQKLMLDKNALFRKQCWENWISHTELGDTSSSLISYSV